MSFVDHFSTYQHKALCPYLAVLTFQANACLLPCHHPLLLSRLANSWKSNKLHITNEIFIIWKHNKYYLSIRIRCQRPSLTFVVLYTIFTSPEPRLYRKCKYLSAEKRKIMLSPAIMNGKRTEQFRHDFCSSFKLTHFQFQVVSNHRRSVQYVDQSIVSIHYVSAFWSVNSNRFDS